MTDKPKQRRGFAAMTREKQLELAIKGGRSVQPENRSFFKDRGLAGIAGAKGGHASRAKRRGQKEKSGG